MDITEHFANDKGKKIALYGLSMETEKVLQELGSGFNILGLLDGFREEGKMYGYPIISLEYAVQNGVELIVVVARPGSCKAIARRIKDTCKKERITLIDIRGRDLLEEKKVSYDFSGLSGVTREELLRKINAADVISFDLFDTLVMRQTLFCEDIAEYVEQKLRGNGIVISDFCRERIAGEKELSRGRAPDLTEIYRYIFGRMIDVGEQEVTAEQLSDLEWKTDYELIVPRKSVCALLQQTIMNGKKVYVVSDSYYHKEQLERILKKCGITGDVDIISSCDYGISKIQGLYQILKDLSKGEKILHIGDDITADIESAQKYELETCKLYSGRDLLDLTGNLGISEHMNSLADRLRIGMFISEIFNSPFQFESDDRYIEISDVYHVGWLFCAPMISDFVLWFDKKIGQQKFQNIWFSARDGYLIQKMYMELLKQRHEKDESVYFMTSRTAAVRAGIRDEDGIQYIDSMHFSGSLEQNLKERFGIDADGVSSKDVADDEKGLLRYKKIIIKQAKAACKNYQKYINSLCVKEGKIAFFDFVAKGTSQMYIQKLVSNQLKGFYFLQLEADDMKNRDLDIQSFYENGQSGLCAIYDNYYILETLLTAPHSSVQGFDEYGQPVYASETRSKKDIRCFKRAQEGILDYFKTYINLCPENARVINRDLDEIFLKLIHEIRITDSDFLNLSVEDSFFNRMTNITDLL